MKFIEKLNNTSKIILLTIYIILLVGILVLVGTIGNGKKEQNVEDNIFGVTEENIPGDENMDLAIRLKERRTLPSTKNGTEKETQYWDFQVYLHLKDQNAIYRNVTIYTAIQKRDGTTKYEEKSLKILTGVENNAQIADSTTDRGGFSSYATTSKTMVYNSSTEEYTKKDGTPEKVFVKVVYEIVNKNNKVEEKTFSYKCDIINSYDLDFDKFDSAMTDTSNNIILNDNIKDILKLKVRTELEEDTSKTDTYRLNVTYNPLKENEKVVKDATIALFLGAKNTESDTEDYFSNYIEFAQYYGSLPYLYTIPQIATAYAGAIDIDNLYVYAKVNNMDGTNSETKVYIPVESLPKY